MTSFFQKLRTKLLPDIGERRAAQFYRDQGSEGLLRFDVDSSDTVAEIGGFQGDWASDISRRYGCSVITTEPVASFAEHMRQRFADNDKITVQQIGVGNSNRTETMHLLGAGSSAFRGGGSAENVRMIDAAEWAAQLPDRVAVLAINCEGGEYEILPRLVETGEIGRFINVLVQFHETVVDAEDQRQRIRTMLRRTHREVFAYPFVWEHWAL